jgi:spermidine/putrescine transport system permease protein
LYAPILVLTAFSFNASRQMAVWTGFTWEWYLRAWQDQAIARSVRTSLIVAGLCTAISLAIGTPAALALGRHKFRGKGAAIALFTLPIVVPEIVIAFASVAFFGAVGWELGYSTVVAAHVAFSVSYVVFVVRSRLTAVDPRLEEAAADLGATPWTTFARVTLPLLMPGIVAAGLLVFTISLDDYVVTSFVAGRGGATLPVQIYSMIKTGITPQINAISTVLLVGTLALVGVSHRFEAGRAGRPALAVVTAVLLAIGAFAIGGTAGRASGRELNVYIWAEYLPASAVAEFERRYGVHVNVELYDSNEALQAKLQTGVARYDIVVPSDYMVQILARQDLLQRLDRDRLTNYTNLSSRFLGLSYDPENAYSVPYCWGTTGLAFRVDRTGRELDSWLDLWEPALADRIGMLNDVREVFSAALKSRGHSLNSTDPDEIAAAARHLAQQKGLVRTYDSDAFADNLLTGEVWASQSYSGQIARAAAENPNIHYVIPKEGCTMFLDNVCIPVGAQNLDLAYLFIDFILEGEVAAAITTSTGYATANREALAFLPPEWRDNPIVYPPEDLLDRCEVIQDLGEAIDLYDRAWTRIKS